jgi:hypothetical protein
MEENKGDVMTFLVISAAIEWLESHHLLMKAMADAKLRAKKDKEEAILTVSFQCLRLWSVKVGGVKLVGFFE